MDPLGPFIIFVILSILLVAISWYMELKRREALKAVATELVLAFSPGDPFEIDTGYNHFKGLQRSDYEWATNVISGNYRTHEVKLFDYHYEIEDTDSEGNKETQHYSFSAAILTLPGELPDLIARPEGLFDKVVQGFGFDDIDLDNHEFSRKYMVNSGSKKFAYDIFTPRMMEYFLVIGKQYLEVGKDSMLMIFQKKMGPDTIRTYLDTIVDVRNMFPRYVFQEEGLMGTIPDAPSDQAEDN